MLFYIHVALLAVLLRVCLTKPRRYNRWGDGLLTLVSGHWSAIDPLSVATFLLSICCLAAVQLLVECPLTVTDGSSAIQWVSRAPLPYLTSSLDFDSSRVLIVFGNVWPIGYLICDQITSMLRPLVVTMIIPVVVLGFLAAKGTNHLYSLMPFSFCISSSMRSIRVKRASGSESSRKR